MSGPAFPYRRIVADLRASILDGRLAPGDRLGSEWELVEEFGTSRPTVRRATAANFRRHRNALQPGFNAQIIEQGRKTQQVLHTLVRGGAITVIEDPDRPIRRTLARSVDKLTSRMPTPAEVEQLHLTSGMPVMRIVRTMYDVDASPVEVQVTIAAADRHSFRYEVTL